MNSAQMPLDKSSTDTSTSALFTYIVSQFAQPRGFWGHVAGHVMARCPSNRARSRWVVDLLDIQPADRVLELGCGPGVALHILSQRARDGFVAGIDHSAIVIEQPAPFDKILAINTHMFWPAPLLVLRQISSLLKPHGTIALAHQPRARSASDANAVQAGEDMARLLEQAGYSDIDITLQPMRPLATACVCARRGPC
jgi:2-polyprenyl-3-methyl-5-hydroxy-6-metoxy-1,4-benzoquinol methylase